MSERKYVVPEGLLKVIWGSARFLDTGNHCLAAEQVSEIGKAVCRWLSEHPIVPMDDEALDDLENHYKVAGAAYVAVRWQRRMFSVPEESEEEKTAAIVRKARKRALDELLAWAKGETIERGVGVDVIRADALARMAHEKRTQPPDPDEAIRDLMDDVDSDRELHERAKWLIKKGLREAYRRGKEGK